MAQTLPYGPHRDQVADILFPALPSGPAPLVIFLHGGFWRAAHGRTHVSDLADDLAQRGYVVANVEYRRSGAGGGFPTTLVDVATAVDVLPGLIEAHRPDSIDADRVVYAGHSAGGHLAVWAALRNRLSETAPGHVATLPPIAGVLALAPVLNLAEAHRDDSGAGAVHEFMQASPDEAPERYAAADPSRLGHADARITLVHGGADEVVPVSMSRQYQILAGATLIELPDADHFDLIETSSSAWPVVLDALRTLTASTT